MTKKYEFGVWTPTAHVICMDCHDEKYDWDRKRELEHRPAPEELNEFHGVTFCDYCGKDIQVDQGIAGEHNLVRTLKEAGLPAEMDQTGGMNSACSIYDDMFEPDNSPQSWIHVLYGIDDGDDKTYYASRNYDDGDYDVIIETEDVDELIIALKKNVEKHAR